MAMSPEQVERKISQLDNDVQSIYEILAAIQGTQTRHSNRFDEIGASLDRVAERLGRGDARLDGVDQRLETLDTRFDSVDAKLDRVIDALGQR